ncbi:MAG: alpha/beta hydrolase family protein, partial [Bryobacteraceae bacterium]
VKTLAVMEAAKWKRTKITFAVEKRDRVPAYLFIPAGLKGKKVPGILCLHQTTAIGKGEPAGLGGKPNLHYAAELAERGYVALAPDYPSFGDYAYTFDDPRYVSGTMKGIVNHMRAVDLLVSLPDVDANRIAVVGHSLGGHNALFVAAFDQRIAAVVTSCGFTSMSKYKGGNLKGWDQKRYMPLIAERYHNSAREMPWDFPDVLTAIAPRPVFVNAPLHDDNFDVSGVDDCVRVVRSRFPPGNLAVAHPDCAHDFPPEVRERAYQFLEGHLKNASGAAQERRKARFIGVRSVASQKKPEKTGF